MNVPAYSPYNAGLMQQPMNPYQQQGQYNYYGQPPQNEYGQQQYPPQQQYYAPQQGYSRPSYGPQ